MNICVSQTTGDITIINSNGNAIVLSRREAKELYAALCEKWNIPNELEEKDA